METLRGIRIVRKAEADQKNRITIHEMQEGEAPYLTFPLLEQQGDWLIHGFSTRLGGVSRGFVSSMNLSLAREKNHLRKEGFGPDGEMKTSEISKESEKLIEETAARTFRENYRRIGKSIGFEPEDAVLSFQTHTVNIRKVTEEDRGKGAVRERDYRDVDGLITDTPGLVLSTFYADCVPLLLADPMHRAIATSHSGWRGTVADMGGETIRAMQREFGTDPKDIIACIGPSICQDCYEVSEDVIEKFREAYPKELWPVLFYEKKTDGTEHKFQLNLWEACRQNFLRAGVREENISLPDLCTSCNPEIFYSHRAVRSQDHGLMAAFIEIIDNK